MGGGVGIVRHTFLTKACDMKSQKNACTKRSFIYLFFTGNSCKPMLNRIFDDLKQQLNFRVLLCIPMNVTVGASQTIFLAPPTYLIINTLFLDHRSLIKNKQ